MLASVFERVQDRQNFQEPDEATKTAFPGLKKLERRQLELLFLLGAAQLPDTRERVADISQNIGYTSLTDHYPCITPKGAKFLSQRCRLTHGVECMRLQGIWLDNLRDFDDELLRSLAGNAFETSCYAAVLWASLIFQSHMHFLSKARSRIPPNILLEAAVRDPASDDDDIKGVWETAAQDPASDNADIKGVWEAAARDPASDDDDDIKGVWGAAASVDNNIRGICEVSASDDDDVRGVWGKQG